MTNFKQQRVLETVTLRADKLKFTVELYVTSTVGSVLASQKYSSGSFARSCISTACYQTTAINH